MRPVAVSVAGVAVAAGVGRLISRTLPEEAAVAMVYNGSTQAVMMASPADLEAFGIGFSLSEGLVAAPAEIEDIEVVAQPAGIEVRMWLAAGRAAARAERRRFMAGPIGCGLCGIESIEEAVRPTPEGNEQLFVGTDDERYGGILRPLPAAD